MPTQAKAAVIDEITERFQSSSAAVLTEYRGLTVAQLTQLRRSLGEGSSYAVVKNTLTKRAAEQVGHADLAPLLNGPTAIALDRKSTRLNSSHANISYAVFCLKKNKVLRIRVTARPPAA